MWKSRVASFALLLCYLKHKKYFWKSISVIAYDWIAKIDDLTHDPKETRFEGFFNSSYIDSGQREKITLNFYFHVCMVPQLVL